MKLFAFLLIVLMTGACTSMLIGASGESAGSAIGQDQRSGAQISADNRIEAAIRDTFALDNDLRALQLRIESHEGVVTLRGSTQSFALRDRAVRIATDINGVERLNNQIRVSTN